MHTTQRGRRKKHTQLLRYPSAFHLSGAEGWLELGNATEALAELERISPSQRLHPDVRYMHWRIFASQHLWNRCLSISRNLVAAQPEKPRGWIALARSFRHTGMTGKAYLTATARLGKFPGCWELYYDTACYACLLGKLDKAADCLRLAINLGNAKVIRRQALHDPDFAKLWIKGRPGVKVTSKRKRE
jgi:hypothetical protein